MSKKVNLEGLITEKDSLYNNLEKMTVLNLIESINKEDQKVPQAVLKSKKQINNLINQSIKTIENGGRIFYIGAGTSGRLGILDASECPPTFGVYFNLVVGLMAGGDKAIRKSDEYAEDSVTQAFKDLQKYKVSTKDFVIGIAASGRTPYVVGGLKQCQKRKIKTGCITCNLNSEAKKYSDYPIEVIVGPEFVTGSSRMKAGTAQKLILNMITTVTFIKTGRVKGNKMVSMKMNNAKLIERGIQMVMKAKKVNHQNAARLLKKESLSELLK
jgi:N-acetylmuramic acid 6-phosphate etherase